MPLVKVNCLAFRERDRGHRVAPWKENSFFYYWIDLSASHYRSIRTLNKFSLFFWWKLMLYFKYVVKSMSLKILPITSHYFLPSFWQFTDSISEELLVFWSYPRIDPFFGIFIRMEVLLSQAMSHRPEQVVVGRSNVWALRRVRKDISLEPLQSFFDDFCNMWPSIVM